MLSTQQENNEQFESSMRQLADFTQNYLAEWESDLKDSYLLALFIANNSAEGWAQAYGQTYCLNFLNLNYHLCQANNLSLDTKLDLLDFQAGVEAVLTDAEYMVQVCAEMAERMQSTYFNSDDYIPIMEGIIMRWAEEDGCDILDDEFDSIDTEILGKAVA